MYRVQCIFNCCKIDKIRGEVSLKTWIRTISRSRFSYFAWVLLWSFLLLPGFSNVAVWRWAFHEKLSSRISFKAIIYRGILTWIWKVQEYLPLDSLYRLYPYQITFHKQVITPHQNTKTSFLKRVKKISICKAQISANK